MTWAPPLLVPTCRCAARSIPIFLLEDMEAAASLCSFPSSCCGFCACQWSFLSLRCHNWCCWEFTFTFWVHQCKDNENLFMEILKLICMGNRRHFHFSLSPLHENKIWMTCMTENFEICTLGSILSPDKSTYSVRVTEFPVVFVWSPFSTYGSPLHYGASLGYRGWSNGILSR